MTSTRRLRRVESENQIWLVTIPKLYSCTLQNRTGKRYTDTLYTCSFYFVGKLFSGSGIRGQVREAEVERVRWYVVHAIRDYVKGGMEVVEGKRGELERKDISTVGR